MPKQAETERLPSDTLKWIAAEINPKTIKLYRLDVKPNATATHLAIKSEGGWREWRTCASMPEAEAYAEMKNRHDHEEWEFGQKWKSTYPKEPKE